MISSSINLGNSALLLVLSATVLASSGCAMLGGGKFADRPLFKHLGRNNVSDDRDLDMPSSLSRSHLDDSDDEIPIYEPSSIQRPSVPNSQFTSGERRTIMPVAATEDITTTRPIPVHEAPQQRSLLPVPDRMSRLPLSSRPYRPMMPMGGAGNC